MSEGGSVARDAAAGRAERLLDSLEDACFAIDQNWRVTYINAAAESFFGRARAALLGRNLLAEFPQMGDSAGRARIDDAMASGSRIRFETLSVITHAPIEIDIQPSGEEVTVFLRDIADRWRLESELRDRDAQLRLAEESAGVGVWEISVADDSVSGTAKFFEIMGLPPTSDPVPMSVIRSLRIEDDRERVNESYRLAVAAGDEICDTEYRIRRPDGDIRWIFGRGRIVRDGFGKAVRYSGVDIDVTGRKAAELALAESEDRLRMAIDAANLGIWDWNPITNEMAWSATAKAIAGLPPEAPVTFAQISGITHPDDIVRTSGMARRALDPAIRAREPYEYRIVRPDGAIRWVLAHGEARFRVIDGVERAVRYTGTIQDVTPRKLAEAKLKQSEARLRLAVDAARLAVWEYDVSAETLHGTPELNRLLGFPDGRKLDMETVRRGYLPGEQERLRAAGEAALASGETHFRVEFRYRRPDGEVRWLLLSAEIVLAPDDRPMAVAGILMDITDGKAAEEYRELLLAEMQHRVKNTIAVIGAMANQTFGRESSQARNAFTSRLDALSRAHDMLSRDMWRSAGFRQAIEHALAPHHAGDGRFVVDGPDLRLGARQVQTLALAINELATNAAKYGALSTPRGRVEVTWSLDGEPSRTFVFQWRESGGPKVEPPASTGFGTRLIEYSLPADFGGEVRIDYLPEGLVCRLISPWPEASA